MRLPEVNEVLGVGLLCKLNASTVAIPVDRTGQVIQLFTQPMPLARRMFRGVAFHDGQPVIVLRLGSPPPSPEVPGRGVLLESQGLAWRCALEVDALVGLQPIRAAAQRPDRPTWLVDGLTEGGLPVAWIELGVLLPAALGGPAGPASKVAA
jgi:hypothetical protein